MKLRPNRIKHKLAAGDTVYVAGGMTHPDDIDAFGPNGFDGVWLEGEHGPVDAAELGNLTRACDIWGMTSVVSHQPKRSGANLSHPRSRRSGHCRSLMSTRRQRHRT